MMTKLWPYIAVFIITLIVDVFWTRYNQMVTGNRAALAGFWSAAIVLGGNFTTYFWLDNHWVTVASMAGAFIGTWLAVKRTPK